MEDKFNLTIQQNIFLAKKQIVENIYNSAKLEGCNVTFPDTQTILDGVNVPTVTISDIECILNLRDAWRYLLSTVEESFTVDYICKINSYVARNEALEWDVLRNGRVGISGTDDIPSIPQRQEVEESLKEILSTGSATQQAIRYLLWGMRSQLFWDSNKRTSTLCANKILISAGKGVITVREQQLKDFNERLTKFYSTNDYSVIDNFVYENCIWGIEFEKDKNTDAIFPNLG